MKIVRDVFLVSAFVFLFMNATKAENLSEVSDKLDEMMDKLFVAGLIIGHMQGCNSWDHEQLGITEIEQEKICASRRPK